jgi:hypothetical protein
MLVLSHREAALFVLVSSLSCLSCARGSQRVEGSPSGLASPLASSPPGESDAAAPSSTPLNVSPSPNAAQAEAGDDSVVDVLTQDDADIDADDGSDIDGDDGGDAVAPTDPGVPLPSPGEVAITEVMLSPSGPEPDSEWFEIYNLASSPRLLSGLTLEDGYGDTHVIASAPPVVIPPGAYGVLVRDPAGAAQSLVPSSAILYAYGTGLSSDAGIELDAGPAGDLSLWSGDTRLVDVPYGMWDASWPGQSIELATPQADATDPAQWCVAQFPWMTGSDDGTPGAPSDCGP